MYYTYVLRSQRDGFLYIGWSDDLQTRFRAHERGAVPSTKNRRPLVLVYYEACRTREDAVQREKTLKTGFGRAYLKRRLSHDQGT